MSSGITASEETKKDFLNALEVGQSCLSAFIKDRIETNDVGFYSTIQKNQLKTFDVKKKTSMVKVKDKNIAIRADRETFGRLLSIQQKRSVDLRKVLEY